MRHSAENVSQRIQETKEVNPEIMVNFTGLQINMGDIAKIAHELDSLSKIKELSLSYDNALSKLWQKKGNKRESLVTKIYPMISQLGWYSYSKDDLNRMPLSTFKSFAHAFQHDLITYLQLQEIPLDEHGKVDLTKAAGRSVSYDEPHEQEKTKMKINYACHLSGSFYIILTIFVIYKLLTM